MKSGLTEEELCRYAQHIRLPEVGLAGQRKLGRASVLIIGLGGLGSISSLYLVGAGLGRIGLVDHDRVELSNLPRQVLYAAGDVGTPKTEAARARLSALNPHCQIDIYPARFASENADKIAKNYDILVDGTDNLPDRYLINELCVRTSRPFVYGAVDRFEGQVALFDPRSGPCYRCAFGSPPAAEHIPLPAERGVLNLLPGLVGLLQAAETIKHILGIGESLVGKLLLVNSLDARFEPITIAKNPHCRACGHPAH